jgi:hypothetical protein
MNTHIIISLPHNNIPKPIIRSIFQLSNIYLVDVEHCTNITYLYEDKIVNDNENVIETLGSIDFDGIYINQHEHVIYAYSKRFTKE